MRSLKIAALAAAFAMPAAASDLEKMTDGERATFRKEVRAYLLDNPEVLVEAMQVLRERDAQAEAQADTRLLVKFKDEIFNDGVSYIGGNPDGDITIVEFLDYRCGYCRKADKDVKKLLADDGNIRLIVKEYPILGPDSDASSALAVATLQHYGDEAYARLHDVLITFQGPVTEKTMPQIAKKAGFDFEPLKPLVKSPAVLEHITRMHALGREMNITGTPSFIINNSFIRGYVPLADMKQIVAQEREN